MYPTSELHVHVDFHSHVHVSYTCIYTCTLMVYMYWYIRAYTLYHTCKSKCASTCTSHMYIYMNCVSTSTCPSTCTLHLPAHEHLHVPYFTATFVCHRQDVCKGVGYKETAGGDAHVWLRSSGRIAEEDLQWGSVMYM